jgi:3-oxoacyl-[acyl-carrier protein] reductase
MDLGLANATAVVTGGSKGMGLAIAETLAADGARVAVMARGREALDAAAEACLAAGAPDAVGISVDMTDADSIAAGFEQVQQRWGALNSLVHTIGPGDGYFEEMDNAQRTLPSRWAPCPGCGRSAQRCRCCGPPTGLAS